MTQEWHLIQQNTINYIIDLRWWWYIVYTDLVDVHVGKAYLC